jgi:hypothetical protein
MKNPFKRKKEKFPTDSVPRTMIEINKTYGEELARAGEEQYLVYVHTETLKHVNQRLLALNQEAAARQQLDKVAAAKRASVEETKAINASNAAAQVGAQHG